MKVLQTNDEVMAIALSLAQKGRYYTQPNPMVGCVITNENNIIIAQGYHQQYNHAHAEINALNHLKSKLTHPDLIKKYKLFVTLEPCAHHGKTQPCVDEIIKSGIKTIVIAMFDPNPKVSGRGIEQLKKSGITVIVGPQEAQARALNYIFIKAMQTGMPFVRCKIAMSLDGKTAMANGQSQWITNKQSRLDVQKLRMEADAILTGSGTVLADNPSLTVRLPEVLRPPIRIVLDSQNLIPKHFNIFSSNAKTQVYHQGNAPLNKNKIDLKALLKKLYQQDINHILLEAGSTLVGLMLAEGLIDEFVFYTAPLLMGNSAKSAIGLDIKMLNNAIDLDIKKITMLKNDLKIIAVLKK